VISPSLKKPKKAVVQAAHSITMFGSLALFDHSVRICGCNREALFGRGFCSGDSSRYHFQFGHSRVG
jgi:hypothetical protein